MPRPCLGINGRCCVLAMMFCERRMSAGMSSSTVSRLSAMPFASTKPISGPMPKFISAMAAKPTMVVMPEAPMDEKAVRQAFAIACSGSAPVARSCVKACSRKME